MTHTKKILASLLTLAVCGNVLQAQEAAPRHEVSATFQGLGLGSMPFRGEQSWNNPAGLSVGFGLGYTYWFDTHFGFHTGLRMNNMSHNHEIGNLDMSFSTSLPMSSLGLPGGSGLTTVNMNAKSTAVQEEQHYTFVELPLMLAMRCHQTYLNVGLSLAKAVSATADYSYTDPSCVITELPDLGVTVGSPVPMTLSGEAEGDVKNRDLPKPFYCLLAAEGGYNFPVGEALDLSVGLFGRFAPIAYATKDAADAYSIQPDATYQLVQPSASTLVEKRGYYEVGLSLGIKFGLISRNKPSGDQAALTSGSSYANATNAELAATKAAREEAERELAAAKAAREEAENEFAAAKAAREKAESELATIEASRKNATNDNGTNSTPLAQQNARQNAARNTDQQESPRVQTPGKSDQLLFTFDYNKTQPIYTDETAAKLRTLCNAMQNDSNIKVVVIGHTDNVGTKRNNNIVGRRRAYAVKRLMVGMGVPAENIAIASRGENEPKESNQTEEGRAHNRRATVELQ